MWSRRIITPNIANELVITTTCLRNKTATSESWGRIRRLTRSGAAMKIKDE
jgi:hypothetical protein